MTTENKLLELQKALKPVKKELTNPYFKSKYADINILLEMVKPELSKLGLTVHQPLLIKDGKNTIATQVMDGKEVLLVSDILLPENLKPQEMGSAITYYRRYALQSLLVLEAEDDDGNDTNEKPVTKPIAKSTSFAAKKREPDPRTEDVQPFEAAKKAISNADTVTKLKNVEERINKSTNLDADEKDALYVLLDERNHFLSE